MSNPSPPRLLVAEDNSVNQKLALAMLQKIGYQADLVSNGKEALDALAKVRYEAILMDCQMPHMDGYQATGELRRQEESRGSGHVPIIAMTAAVMEGEKERCIAAGMDDYLAKPFKLGELEAILRRWVLREPVPPPGETSEGDESSRPVDPARVAELRELTDGTHRDGFTVLAELFVEDAHVRVVSMRQAIDRDDAVGVGREAHALKGSAANVGAVKLAQTCGDLEDVASSGNLAEGHRLLTRVEAEFLRVDDFLREQLRK
ncbi:MAG: response regulator [Actinomycetota bacterium]